MEGFGVRAEHLTQASDLGCCDAQGVGGLVWGEMKEIGNRGGGAEGAGCACYMPYVYKPLIV